MVLYQEEHKLLREALQHVVDTLNIALDKRLPEVSDGGSMESLCGMLHEWEDLLHRTSCKGGKQ